MPMRPLLTSALILALAACNEGLPTRPRNRVLEPGVAVTISGGLNSQTVYTVSVPEGTGKLRVLLAGFTGDADIYLRYGAEPAEGLIDCASATEFDVEECIVDAPTAGTWYILVYGYSAYSGASLQADLLAQLGERPLTPDAPVAGLTGAQGDFEMFALTVPAGLDSLAVDLVSTGDADLYLGFDAYPALNAYACASFTPTGTERCVVAAPTAGTWYVRVDAYLAFTNGTLGATFYAPAPPP